MCTTESVDPYNILILISLAYMLVTFDDTGIRESTAFWFTSLGGNDGRTRLFFYCYLLLIGINMVLGKDPIIRECSAYPRSVCTSY